MAERKPKPGSPWDDYSLALMGAAHLVRERKVTPTAFRLALRDLIADVARADRAEREADVPDEPD